LALRTPIYLIFYAILAIIRTRISEI